LDGEALRIIVGPTAAGKSALALSLAQQFASTIISADSRQIYNGFDIGTGKATRDELALVPHEGIDVADPSERWSAAAFANAAQQWIETAKAAGRTPVVVGGTGFWISALVAPLAYVPELDAGRRELLSAFLDTLPSERLHAWCAVLDPHISRLGPAQWRRAIEVAMLTGRRLSFWHATSSRPTLGAARSPRYLLLDPGRALDDRIAARVDAMLAAGWADEVLSLMTTVPAGAVAWKACGYERLRTALSSGQDVASVRDDIVAGTRRYARRQRTWFRRQLKHGPVTQLDPCADDALVRAAAWWKGENDS
jgi:tRNA dimethylallyltransferase